MSVTCLNILSDFLSLVIIYSYLGSSDYKYRDILLYVKYLDNFNRPGFAVQIAKRLSIKRIG